MRSTLDKALAALLAKNINEANELFHQYVIEHAGQINNELLEGKTFKRNDDDEADPKAKKKEDKERKDGTKQKRQVAESMEPNFDDLDDGIDDDFGSTDADDLEEEDLTNADPDEADLTEGKTFKRNKDEDADDKKKQDQDRKDGSKQKRQMEEGKTFKRNKDEDADDKKKQDQERKSGSKQKRQMEEGKLEVVQSTDGTLTLTHNTDEADGLDQPGMVMDPVEPVAPLASLAVDAASEFDPMDPMVGVEDLSDTDFDNLHESLAAELAQVTAITADSTYANGDKATNEPHSPVPNVDAKKRVDGAKAVEIKSTDHSGFDREQAPSVVSKPVADKKTSFAGLKDVPAGGDSKAALNQKVDVNTVSPIGSKK